MIAIILLDKKNYVKIEYILIICLPAMLIAGTYIFTNVLYSELGHYWYGWRFNSVNNPYSFFVGMYFIIYGALSIFLITKFYIRQKNKMKTRALYAMIGLSIPIICVLIAEGILPLFNNQIPPLGSLFTCIGTISLSISILKYKFIISVHSKTIDKLFGDSKDFLIIINQDHEIISGVK